MPEKVTIPETFWKWLALALLVAVGGWFARELFRGPEQRAEDERAVITAALAANLDSIERLEIQVVALAAAAQIPVYSVPEGEATGRCVTVNADSIAALLRGEGTRQDARAVERCRDEMVKLTERLRRALRESAER